MAERIRLSRAKGFKLPPNSVSVARPGPWGNPYRVEDFGIELALKLFENTVQGGWSPWLLDHVSNELCAQAYALHCAFRKRHQNMLPCTYELRGKNLACWCKAGPCHADVLLRLANEAP